METLESNLEKRTRKVSEFRTLAGGQAIQEAWLEWQKSFSESAEVWEAAQQMVDMGFASNVAEALPSAIKLPRFKDKGLKLSTCSPSDLVKLIRGALLRTDIDQTAVLTAVAQAMISTLPAESVTLLRDRVTKLSED